MQGNHFKCKYFTIILLNLAEYRLMLGGRGRGPSWLKSGDIRRKIEQDNCFINRHIDDKAQFSRFIGKTIFLRGTQNYVYLTINP